MRPPVPLELLAFGVEATLSALEPTRLRGGPPSPDGGLIADYLGPVHDPATLAARFAVTPGVVEHGIFPPDLVSEILVAHGDEVERRGRRLGFARHRAADRRRPARVVLLEQ